MRPAIVAVALVTYGGLTTLLGACGGITTDDVEQPGAGIASKYPGDLGIAADPRVLFADDFESYATASDLDRKWSARYHEVSISLTEKYAGNKAVEMRAPMMSTELSSGLAKVLEENVDTLYLRYYSKFDSTFDISGMSHNGAEISANYYVDGNPTPGVPANGTNKYLVAYEDWRADATTPTPGDQNIFIYHPEQRSNDGDRFFPDGRVMPNETKPYDFGSEFVQYPMYIPEVGRWYAFEVMLQANTPGMHDGRVTCWVDGEIIADFPGLRLRDIDTLKIDRIGLSLHFGSNPTIETRKWYDNVVAATAYIGPMAN